jgi:hypothetical protein
METLSNKQHTTEAAEIFDFYNNQGLRRDVLVYNDNGDEFVVKFGMTRPVDPNDGNPIIAAGVINDQHFVSELGDKDDLVFPDFINIVIQNGVYYEAMPYAIYSKADDAIGVIREQMFSGHRLVTRPVAHREINVEPQTEIELRYREDLEYYGSEEHLRPEKLKITVNTSGSKMVSSDKVVLEIVETNGTEADTATEFSPSSIEESNDGSYTLLFDVKSIISGLEYKGKIRIDSHGLIKESEITRNFKTEMYDEEYREAYDHEQSDTYRSEVTE